jgi:hypothetical protein
MQGHSLSVGHGKSCDKSVLHTDVECCLLAVVHRKTCDETVFHNNAACTILLTCCWLLDMMKLSFTKIWNVTHKLLVIGKDVMRLDFTNVQCTHKLLLIGKDVMRLPLNIQSHSLAVGHRKDVMRLTFTKCAMSPLTACCS